MKRDTLQTIPTSESFDLALFKLVADLSVGPYPTEVSAPTVYPAIYLTATSFPEVQGNQVLKKTETTRRELLYGKPSTYYEENMIVIGQKINERWFVIGRLS